MASNRITPSTPRTYIPNDHERPWRKPIYEAAADGKVSKDEASALVAKWAKDPEAAKSADFQEDLRKLVKGQKPHGQPVDVAPEAKEAITGAMRELPSTVKLPVVSLAGYPFTDYLVKVGDLGKEVVFPGRAEQIIYGYTDASREQYEANNDVPWQNAEGDFVAEGIVPANIQHDGGYKGTMIMAPVELPIPEGKNLVFKIGLEKQEGLPGSHQDVGYVETKTYFVDNPRDGK